MRQEIEIHEDIPEIFYKMMRNGKSSISNENLLRAILSCKSGQSRNIRLEGWESNESTRSTLHPSWRCTDFLVKSIFPQS